MKQNSSSFVNNSYYAKWMRMLLMSFMLLLSSSLYATTFYIQGSTWLNLSNSNTIMTASGSSYTYTFTSDNTGSGQWFKIFKDNQNNDQNYMLFYNGSEKDNVPLNQSLSCSIGGYAEFKMSVEKGVIYNITVTYTSNSNVKLLITATEPIVITPNKEAPYYLKDQITLTAKGGKGGSGDYEWYKKEPSDSDYTQIAGAYNATYSFTLDGSYIYKVVDTTTGVESTIDIKPSVRCDEANTKVIFSEDFGWLDFKERAESEYAKYSYKAACTSIKNGGEYAIVAVPVWGGCNVIDGDDYGDPCYCPAYTSPGNINMWFNEKLDHATEESYLKALKESHPLYSEEEIQNALEAFRTDFATNESVRQTYSVAPQSAKDNNKLYGGMLLFNCKGGSDDILYERKIDVCDNTYINFSAWFTKANVSNADKIGAKFVLLNGSTRGELDSYTVDNIDVNAGWKQVSAMFNSKNCGGSVIVQLINYAPAGDNGNDLLVDDISLSICTPEASLYADYAGRQTDNVQAMIDEDINLISEIDNVIFSGSPFYWWQKKEVGSTNWTPLTLEPIQNKETYQVKVSDKKTEYRVIVANTKQAAKDAADDLNSDELCGLYSVTTSVLVEPILLTITPIVSNASICSEGANTYTLTAENTSSVAINDVYAQVIIPDGLEAYKYGTEIAFDGKWHIGNLAANTGKAELKLTLKSTTKVTDITSLSIKAYISAIGTNSSWSSYTEAAIKKEISFNLKPLPGKPTFVSKSYYEECALTGSNTNVYFNTLIKGTGLKVYSNKELTNAVEYFAGATPTTKQVYYANQTIDGCTGDTVQFPITVRQLPELKSISVDDNAICTGGSTNINYTIAGGVGQYTLTMKREMNDATQTFDIANLGTKDISGVTSSFEVTPTSKATFSFTQVKDAYCTNTVDASVILPVTVDVKSINITKQPYITNLPICADTKAELKVDTEGDDLQYQWYESTDGNNYTAVGENKNTHTTGQLIKADDKKYSYKVFVSQSPKVCEQIESKPVEVNVNDCSEFSMQYVPTKNEICQDATIDLAFSLENTSTTMAQTGVEVTITGLVNQTLTLPSSATRVGDNIIWKVGDLQPGTKQEITITLKGTEAETINSKAYVSKSGSNTYTEADQKALVPQTITVKAISRNPIVTPYASCPITGSINLVEDYVTLKDEADNVLTDESGVKFYTLDDATGNYTQTTGQFNTGNDSNENVEETFYVSNQNTGECESEKVALTATVYPPVKATISGDDIICNSENAYLAVNIPSGKPDFTLIKYKVAVEGAEESTEIELKDVSERVFSIPVSPTSKTVYTLTYVEDANKCKADLSKSGSATVEVNNKPSFTLKETTLGDLCAGTALQLPTITVDDGGTAITEQGWYLAGQAISSIDELSIESHNGKKLTYKATNQCGTEEKTYTTLSVKDCADFTLTYVLSNANPCAGDVVTLTATITNDGDTDLSGVNLWQTWSGNQGVVATVEQFVWDMGDYQNGKWEIATFPSKATATLTITFIAQANEEFKMHVTESNGIPYDSWTNSPAKDKATLTVKPISGDVQLNDLVDVNATYKTCALDATSTQTLSLSSLVGSDKFSLQYYEEDATGVMKQDPLTAEPVIELNKAFGPKNYYIINTEDGKCPSKTPTKVTVQVLAKPTISLTEEDVTLNCNNQTPTVTVSGASTYKWTDDATGAETTGDKLNLSRKDDSPRTYTVVGYSADNCASDALTLTVKEDFVAPDAKISIPSGSYAINDSTLTCTLTSLELTASSTVSGVTYKWNDTNASTSSSITVNKANVYQVTVTNPNNGCSASAVKTILSNTKDPILSVSVLDAAGKPATALTCAADKDTLSLEPSISNATEIGNKNITYTWSTNVIEVDNTTHAATVDEKAIYRVTVVGDTGCSVYEDVTIDADQTKPVLSIASSNDTLTCLLPDAKLTATVSNVEMQSYSWTKKDDAGLSNVGSDAVITVSDSAMYIVTATAVNGCVEKDTIVVPQRTDLPKVEIASTDSEQYCRVNTLTASGALTYKWSTGSDDASIGVSEAGTYTVTGTNQYGCAKDTTLVLTDGKVIPVVKVESNPSEITCTNENVTFTASVSNAINEHTYAYQWTINNETAVQSSKNTLSVADGKTYKVVVTDKDNFCQGEKTYSVSVKKETPLVVQDAAWAPVCLPATINLEDAIDATKTTADKVLFFEDEELTKPVTNTQFDMKTYKVYYAQGIEVNGNGCKGVATPIAVNLKPATPAPVVKDYDECVKAEPETFSPLVTSDSYKLTFYDVAQGGTPIADAFDASKANTTTTYYVTNTNQGACESERTAFTVHIEGLVDFDLTISDEEVMMGGEDVVITLIPAEVDVESYKWMANDKVLDVEGDEYVTKPYVDTKYVVAAKGRCNTLTQEVDVVVIWPTAFTPYNNNGLNETFAKGFEVKIYNRHGIQIFEGSDGWDGVMNQNMGQNVMAVPGVYYYAVPLPDGNVKKGTIEIVKF